MKKNWMAGLIAGGFCLSLMAASLQATDTKISKPLVMGEIVTLHSDILSQDRILWMYVPEGYQNSLSRYPVLYLMDGERNFLHVAGIVHLLSTLRFIPEMIVAAVLNADRDRDFSPTKVDGYPQVAGAAQFLLFMKNELVPFVDENYRTSPARILFGHSLSGLFAAYAFVSQPQLFSAFILTCPSLAWDEGALLKKMPIFLEENPGLHKFLYLTVAAEDDEPTLKACAEFAELLKRKAPKTLDWHYRIIRDESHGSAAHPTVYQALKTIYSGWRIPNSQLAKMTLAEVREHYRLLSRIHGDVVPALEVSVSELGYIFLDRKQFSEAIEACTFNVNSSPQSAYRNSEMGYAYECAGKLALAQKYFEAAVKWAEKDQDSALPGYKADVRRLQEKLEKQGTPK
jgi:hypothetical protein